MKHKHQSLGKRPMPIIPISSRSLLAAINPIQSKPIQLNSTHLMAICPLTLWTRGVPSPLVETRSVLVLIPYSPLKAQGMRMEPPMSVPMERGVPRQASSALSPPELPPGVLERKSRCGEETNKVGDQ